ncbi:conjugal transfer protein TraG N-terminal domain-containing protein, partial [Pseudomonadota bacterium]
MYEIITYGGGEVLVDIFNGIVRIVGSNNYLSAIKISLALTLFLGLLEGIAGNSLMNSIKRYAIFIFLYNAIFLPRVDVIIIDRLNPGLVGATIDDVPYGLAMFASLTSDIGDKLTKLKEENYTLPDDLKYHRSGMIMGSKLLRSSTSFRVTNSLLAENLRSFTQQCIFYDILLNKYTLEDLKNEKNIWEFAKDKASPARSFTYNDGTTKTIKTCQAGAADINTQWTDEVNRSAQLFGIKYFPHSMSLATARNTLLTMLPLSYDTIADVSQDASDLIKQNMMINILTDSTESFAV